MANDVEFRTSLKGFNKEDVTEFIKKQSDEFASRAADFQRELSSVNEKISQKEEEYSNLFAAYKEQEAMAESAKSSLAALDEELTAAKEEIAALNEKLVKASFEAPSAVKPEAYAAEMSDRSALNESRLAAQRELSEAKSKRRAISEDFIARKALIDSQKRTIASTFSQISQSVNAFYASLDKIEEEFKKD